MNTTERRGSSWMQSHTGRQVFPLDPRVSDFCIEDIAHSLACQNRFAGHTREPYSVAEHSVRVYERVRDLTRNLGHPEPLARRACLAALLHDASEAYLVDVPRPIKGALLNYHAIEARLQNTINLLAGLPAGSHHSDLVKLADEELLATEARDLLGPRPAPWTLNAEPLPEVIRPWHWTVAKHNYLAVFSLLTKGAEVGVCTHFHHCPICYERTACMMDCTIADESDDLPMGYHRPCDDCAKKEPTNG